MPPRIPPHLQTEPSMSSEAESNYPNDSLRRHLGVAPSLPEAHRTVPFSSGTSWIRKVWAFAGPGYLVAVGDMDPGNWATDLGGGPKFGNPLPSVMVLRNLMARFMRRLSLRLGMASGRVLA